MMLEDRDGRGPRSDWELAQLLGSLRRLWSHLQISTHTKWKRTLSFGDYIVDRWDKAKALGFGEGSSVYDSAVILGDVSVGANTWVGPFVVLDGTGGLTIGDNCSVSAGVQIYTHDSVDWAISGGRTPYSYAPTSIGNRCYLGPNTIVAKGVAIGDGCVVGANSLVLESLPAGSVAFGNPCRPRSK